jgi:hypothetical protein
VTQAARPRVEAPAHVVEVEDEGAGHDEAVHAHAGHDGGSRPQAPGEPRHRDEERGEQGGPPPPVVPAIRKGAKASLRRKGAR